MEFKAAIIDLDGVMLDSLGVWREIDTDFVRRYNIANPDAVIERLQRIPSLIDAGRYLHTECGLPQSPQEIADEFVELVERGETSGPRAEAAVRARVEPLLAAGADHLVLGCTHFPHLKPLIEQVAAGRAKVVEPSDAVARQAERLLAERGLLNPSGGASHIFIR